MTPPAPVAWLDVSAGAAGDMICAALIDAGAPLDALQDAVDAVVPGGVRLRTEHVTRAGLRATRLLVDVVASEPPHRSWTDVRALLDRADLPAPVRTTAMAVFTRIAAAEGRVHGVHPEQVHFHEVGALDSIADVVGAGAALHALGVQHVDAGRMALGSGHVVTAHGRLPVPVPAVLDLLTGWDVVAGGDGELTTPTGAGIVTALGRGCRDLPPLTLQAVGVGAGRRDTPGRPNVVRVVLGARTDEPTGATAVVLETNVDDLDPRVWPVVIQRLLAAGASDAWLAPILMKKGRPAHMLSVLAEPHLAASLRWLVLRETSAIGIRERTVVKHALERTWVDVAVAGGSVRIKVASHDHSVVHAMPEFEDVAAVAERSGRAVRDVMEEAIAASVAAGLVPGSALPTPGGHPHQ